MFLDMAGRHVVIAGGGEQAAQKMRLLSRTEARLSLMAEALSPELAEHVSAGRAAHVPVALDEAALSDATYVFIALEDEAEGARVAAAAREAGALVNVVDRPEACDMIFPALVDRDPVVVAIGTEGAAPVLGQWIKTRVEALLPPDLGLFVAMARRLRGAAEAVPAGAARRRFWRWALLGAPRERWRSGDRAGAEAMIAEAAASGGAPEDETLALTLIPIPAAPDLFTLRDVERLQAAGTVIHPEGLATGFLDLARRDAARLALPRCPRHDPGALDGLEGPLVALCRQECRVQDAAGSAPSAS